MNIKTITMSLSLLTTSTLLSGQTPASRYIFDDFCIPRTYSQPTASTAKTLAIAAATAHIEINTSSMISRVRATQFGVNTPFRNGPDQRTRSSLYNQKVTTLRFPAGSGSNTYFFDGKVPATMNSYVDQQGVTQSVTAIKGTNTSYLSPSEFISFKNDVNGQAIVVVNYFYARYGTTTTGTRAARVQQAADYAASFVRKLNIELGGHVKYFEIGNECYGKWEVGYQMANAGIGTVSGTEYAEDFNVFVSAMKAVDPGIKCGVVLYDGGTGTWNSEVLPVVKNTADFISVHEYFTTVTEGNTFSNVLGAITEVNTLKTNIQNDIVKYTGNPADYYPIAMTEFNSRGPYNCSMVNGVFISEILGEVIKNDFGLASLWVSEWAWDATSKDCKGFLAKSDPDQADYTARQAYIPFYYYAKCFGDTMVNASSDNTNINVYASTFSSGEVGVVLVNQSATQQELNLKIKEGNKLYTPNTLEWYEFYSNTLDLTNPQYKKFYINGETSTTNGGGPADLDAVKPYLSSYDETQTVTIKPYSVIYMVIKTDNMNPVYSVLYDDGFETGNGYNPNFKVVSQTAWNILNPTNNLNPNTNSNLLWQDIYSSTSIAADKTYSAEAYTDERIGGIGNQCLKLTINDMAFGAAGDKTVRLRGASNKISFNTANGETLANKYEVSLWARVDGATKNVFKSSGSAAPIAVSNTWKKYVIDRYTTGTSATALGIDFVTQTDNSNLVVYIDDVEVKLKSSTPLMNAKAYTLDELPSTTLSIYPQPASDIVQINSTENIRQVIIYNLSGFKIAELQAVNNSFSIRGLKSGMYLMSCQSETALYTQKILVK